MELRDEIARAIRDAFEDGRPSVTTVDEWHGEADAVLRVVGERLLSTDVVRGAAARSAPHVLIDDAREVLSAAWRVVTGSKDGDER